MTLPHSTSLPLETQDPGARTVRRHDLDALRAAAMLLGVAYHAALSFSLGAGWVVEDTRQSKALFLFQAFVHGFRMQLFMLVSGFFSAMLWRKHGLKKLLLHRLRRVLLPCLVGLVTVVPAIHWAQSVAVRLQHPVSQNTTGNESDRAVVFHGANDVKHAANTEHRMHGEEWFSGQSSTGLGSFLRNRWENWKNFPVFILLWFLWFLVWFMPGFSIYALAAERFGWRIRPHALIASQGSLVWLVPLTAIPVCWMGNGRNDFGPDTSMGILPAAHVLGYYGLFFGFGVLYSECDDAAGRLGRCWRWTLPVALVLVFPLAVEFSSGVFGLRNHLAPPAYHRRLSIVLQSLYPWMMVFACTGVFRAMLARESRWIRYISDASYWFYLTHLPLVILAQAAVRDYDFPAVIKFLLICSTVTAVLFLSYAKCVRYSFVGTFLNGSHSVPSLRKT